MIFYSVLKSLWHCFFVKKLDRKDNNKQSFWPTFVAVVIIAFYGHKADAMTCAQLFTAEKGEILQLSTKTVSELVERYFSFKESYDQREDKLREDIDTLYQMPEYQRTMQNREQLIDQFYKSERAYTEALQNALVSRPSHERIAYLKGLNREALIKHAALLDFLFGLKIKEMDENLKAELESENYLDQIKLQKKYGDEEIWYAPGAGQQTPWFALLEVVDAMNLKPGQLVSDFGSGIGRLGLLIGFLRPDVNFVGLEIVGERVKYANQAAAALGFDNVKFHTVNLSDAKLHLPPADHIYMFNPTNSKTSEIVTQKLVQLSKTKKFRVYLLTGLQSSSFRDFFKLVEAKNLNIYERRSDH